MTKTDNLQDFPNCAVPDNTGPRFNWLYLTNVEAAVAVCVPVLMFGAFLGNSLSYYELLLSLACSGLILGIISGWSSYIGTKTRLSTALLVKKSFGYQGAKLIWIILALGSFGWFGLQTELFAKAFISMFGKIYPSLTLNETFIIIISGALMSSTAILGIKGVGKLAQLSMPLLLCVLGYSLFIALSQKGISVWFSLTPEKPISIGVAIASIVGAYSIGAIIMPNVKRFAVNEKHSIWSGVLALGVFYPLLLLIAAVTAVLMKQPDFMELLLSLGLGGLTLFILMLSTWTTNDINLYGASLSLTPIFPKFKRTIITAICGACGTVLACFGLFENMTSLFMLLGVLTTPLIVIYSLDFIKDIYTKKNQSFRINYSAFVSWGIASIFGIMSTPVAEWGLGIFKLTTVPCLDSLIVSAILYLLISKILKN